MQLADRKESAVRKQAENGRRRKLVIYKNVVINIAAQRAGLLYCCQAAGIGGACNKEGMTKSKVSRYAVCGCHSLCWLGPAC